MNRVQFSLDNYIRELEYLVNIDSGSNYPEGVKRIADFFSEKYNDMNWMVKEHNFNEAVGPCLEIKNKDVDTFDVLFIGHMDTVFPIGTVKERPFKIEAGIAYGPGVIDMKSGLLSLYYAMKNIYLEKEDAPSFCIAHNSDEEISSIYSNEWIQSLAKRSKYTFVLEPARTNGALVLERKGLAKYNIDIEGIAVHAGVEPEKGASAITELGHWIVELSKMTNLEIGTTVNVGVISGGTKANVVADKAKAQVDIRFRIEEEGKRIDDKINELRKRPFISGTKIRVSKVGHRPPMNPSEKTEELCKVIEQVGKSLGIDIKWAATGGGSDANFTAAVGTPSIDGLGPVGGGSHGISEHLEIDSIQPRLNLLIEVIKQIVS